MLDANLTEELIDEGFLREVVSKVQTMRKEAGFDVTDRIALTYLTGERLSAVLENGKAELMRAVLATSVESAAAADGAFVRGLYISGEAATIGVKVAK